jgi:hypothetical protein
MEPYMILAGAAVAAGFWNIVTSFRIVGELRRRNMRASVFWLRAMAPVYAFRYKKVTTEETGRPGPLFAHWIISINLALVLAVAALLSKAGVLPLR